MFPYNPDTRAMLRESLLSVWDGVLVDAWLDVVGGVTQDSEDTTFDIRTALYIFSSTGEALDKWGALLGEGRGTQDDLTYRRTILAKAVALVGRGSVQDVQLLADTLTGGSSEVTPEYPANFRLVLDVESPLSDEEVARYLRILDALVPAGVGDRNIEAADFALRFDDPDRGLDLGLLGRIL